MSTKVNKTAIGAFVLGAIVLLVAAVLVLGGGKFFKTEHTYITYFDGSVKGLNVGSPVTFRGVRIGDVKSIGITFDPASKTVKIPVVFNLEPSKIKGTQEVFQRDPKRIEMAVKDLGLRTQLQTQSFVTGQLVVSLDFFPGTRANFVGLSKEYIEIPSVPTSLEQLQRTLERLPLREIIDNLNTTLLGIQRIVASVDMKKTAARLDAGIQDLQTLLRHLDASVNPLVDRLSSTSGAAEVTLGEANKTMAEARGHMKTLTASTAATLETAQATLKQSEQTLHAYSADSQLVEQMNTALRELAASLRALRNLSDYLERHPESVLRGKRNE